MRAGAAAAAPWERRTQCLKSPTANAVAFASARTHHEEDEHEQRATAWLARGHDPPGRAAQGGRWRSGAERERVARGLREQRHQRRRTDPDIMRQWNMYESLAVRSPDFSQLEMLIAESIEPAGSKPNAWTVRLKDGIEFHNGKTVGADDVIFSLKRITDPKDPKTGNSSLSYIDRDNLKKVDARTVTIPLKLTNAAFPDDLGQYFNAIVPTDYDPK